jgi:Family of unknown function (DUF6267)
MILFTEYLKESKEGKNLHLEHLEDEVLNGGVSGTRGAISFLQSLRDMLAGNATGRTVNLTTKWDGAPAIFAGINPENGKFFVGTKGVFAQNAKLNYTNADIDANHPGEGLNKKLKIALRYLPELGIDGVLQGDMMFTSADLKSENIEGKSYVTFQPNTIVYAIPSDTNLANSIKSAKMGIVWHTTYSGDTMSDMKASFGADVGRLKKSKNVWYRDAEFVDATGTATFTKQETDELNSILSQAGSLFRTISPRTLNAIATNDTHKIAIKAWNNLKVREGKEITNTTQHVAGLISSVEEKLNKSILEAKKADTKQKRQQEKKIVMDFYKSNKNELKKIFDLQNLLVRAKNMIVRKLQQVQDSVGTYLRVDDKGLKVTNVEGFVAVDKLNNKAVKLVDRLSFSTANFNVAKNWSK